MKRMISYLAATLALSQMVLADDRVLSLDYCADQFVLGLGDESQIIGVSNEARDDHSFYRDRAENIPRYRATADIILTLKPSLVVRSWAGDQRLLTLLEKLNIPVVTITYAEGRGGTAENIARVAAAIGQDARADAMIADINARRTALEAMPSYNTQATYLTPGAYTSGSGTFVDKVMALAGLGNAFADAGFTGWVPIPMEHMVKSPPSLIVTSFYDSHSAVQNHWGIARHNYVRGLIKATPGIDVPGSMMSCSGLFMVDAAEHLRREMDTIIKENTGE